MSGIEIRVKGKAESMKNVTKEERLSGEMPTKMKRTNTYVVKDEDKSPILDKMEKQEIELEKLYHGEELKSPHESSSEDDEEFIRQSIINNQKRFSVMNMDYFEKESLSEIKEEDHEIKPTLTICSEERENGLSQLCDKLISLNDLVTDKNDRIFTNFDCLLFFLEVSDIINLQM